MAPTRAEVLPMWRQEQRIIEDAIEQLWRQHRARRAALELSPSTIYRKRQAWAEMDGKRGRGLALRELVAHLLGGGEGLGFFAEGRALLDHGAVGIDQRPVPLGVGTDAAGAAQLDFEFCVLTAT